MVLLIIQARMGSTRLPGKVLKEVLGQPLLKFQTDRVRQATTFDMLMIATSNLDQDKVIADFCTKSDLLVFRGSPHDVLDRFYQGALSVHPTPDIIVRLTADCPLIDPRVIDEVVGVFKAGKYDYVANTVPPGGTFPDGMDVEVFSFAALKKAWEEATEPSDREHVTFYFWHNPQLFKCFRVDRPTSFSSYRLTVDYPDDFKVVENILHHLHPKNPAFKMEEVIAYLDQHPEIRRLNSSIAWNQGWKTK